jgi:hypothetical protein
MHLTLPAVDRPSRGEVLRARTDAVVDELSRKLEEPIWVWGRDDDFAEVISRCLRVTPSLV